MSTTPLVALTTSTESTDKDGNSDSNGGGVSAGAIAAIVILLLLVGIVVFIAVHQYQRKRADEKLRTILAKHEQPVGMMSNPMHEGRDRVESKWMASEAELERKKKLTDPTRVQSDNLRSNRESLEKQFKSPILSDTSIYKEHQTSNTKRHVGEVQSNFRPSLEEETGVDYVDMSRGNEKNSNIDGEDYIDMSRGSTAGIDLGVIYHATPDDFEDDEDAADYVNMQLGQFDPNRDTSVEGGMESIKKPTLRRKVQQITDNGSHERRNNPTPKIVQRHQSNVSGPIDKVTRKAAAVPPLKASLPQSTQARRIASVSSGQNRVPRGNSGQTKRHHSALPYDAKVNGIDNSRKNALLKIQGRRQNPNNQKTSITVGAKENKVRQKYEVHPRLGNTHLVMESDDDADDYEVPQDT